VEAKLTTLDVPLVIFVLTASIRPRSSTWRSPRRCSSAATPRRSSKAADGLNERRPAETGRRARPTLRLRRRRGPPSRPAAGPPRPCPARSG
jgi:hypothetical protein